MDIIREGINCISTNCKIFEIGRTDALSSDQLCSRWKNIITD